MVEVDTTHLWQMQYSIDARGLCASAPASLFRTQSEFGLAWAKEMSARKQADTARLQLTLRRPVVSHNGRGAATYTLTNSFPSPASGALRGAMISGLQKVSTHIMPAWVSPYPCRFFSCPDIPVKFLS